MRAARETSRRHGSEPLVSENPRAWRNLFDGIKAFSETDFTEDLKKIDGTTLILHGDYDQRAR